MNKEELVNIKADIARLDALDFEIGKLKRSRQQLLDKSSLEKDAEVKRKTAVAAQRKYNEIQKTIKEQSIIQIFIREVSSIVTRNIYYDRIGKYDGIMRLSDAGMLHIEKLIKKRNEEQTR